MPLVQLTLTLTDAPLFGTKSFTTVKVALFCVLVMVQEPVVSVALQVPVEVYPVGIGDSVAVQVGLPVYPVMTVLNAEASEAVPDEGVAVPLPQEMLTLTLAPLLGEKSLFTTNACVFRLLTIVQLAEPPLVIATPAQAVCVAV